MNSPCPPSLSTVTPLHMERHGEGSPPVIFVHGLGGHLGFWRKWVPTLAQNHEVILLDLMGFGRSPTPRGGDYSPLAQATRVAEVARRLDGRHPVLIGHSLGGGIVVAAALRLLDEGGAALPEGLVLISAALYPQKLPPFLTLARTPGLGELFLAASPPRFLMRLGIRGIVSRREVVDRAMVDLYLDPIRSRDRRRAILRAARQIDLKEGGKVTDRLGDLRIPTLLLWGEEDRIVPPALGERLARDLPGAHLVTLPGIGHLPPEEDPEASLAPVLRFLAERKGAPRVRRRRQGSGDSANGGEGAIPSPE